MKSLLLLASVIMAESKGEGEFGMALVADVIHERSIRQGISPEEVVRKPYQFDGLNYAHKQNLRTPEGKRAIYLASMLEAGIDPMPSFNYTHFRRSAPPSWATNIIKYNNHYFHHERGKEKRPS